MYGTTNPKVNLAIGPKKIINSMMVLIPVIHEKK